MRCSSSSRIAGASSGIGLHLPTMQKHLMWDLFAITHFSLLPASTGMEDVLKVKQTKAAIYARNPFSHNCLWMLFFSSFCLYILQGTLSPSNKNMLHACSLVHVNADPLQNTRRCAHLLGKRLPRSPPAQAVKVPLADEVRYFKGKNS